MNHNSISGFKKKKERTTTLSGILSFSSAFLTHVLCLWTGCRSWRPTRRFICSEFHTLQHHLICTRTEAKLLWKQVRGGHGFTKKSEMSFIWTVNSVKRHRYELPKGNSAPVFKNGMHFMRVKKCKSDRTAVKFDSSQGNLKHVLHLVSFLPSSQRMLFCTITARLWSKCQRNKETMWKLRPQPTVLRYVSVGKCFSTFFFQMSSLFVM